MTDFRTVFRRSFKSSYGTISYIERSGKIPVIFLHGLGGTGNSWMKLPQYLKEGIGLYFLDLVGQGRSAKPDIEYTISVQEDVIGELTEALGLEDISLVGNSYGGWIAMRYSLDRKQPTHLVLEDSAGVNRTFGEMEEGSRDQFVEMVVRSNPMNAQAVISNIVKNNSNPSWKLKESELKKLKAKTLIIWGKDDEVIPIENGRMLHAYIQGSTFVEMENGNHVPHVQFPEKFADLLNTFLTT